MRLTSYHRSTGLSVSLIVAVVLLALGIGIPTAQAQPQCGVPIAIPLVNGGFEELELAPRTSRVLSSTSLPGWTVAGRVLQFGPNISTAFASQTQYVQVGNSSTTGSLSQALDGTTLAGSTVTITVLFRQSGTMSLGDQSQSVTGPNADTTNVLTFAVPADAPDVLALTLSGGGGGNAWFIDQISGTYVVPCPPAPVLNPACADAANAIGPFAGARIIYAQPGVPTFGGTGTQVIIGTNGDDVIDGGTGNDLICGGGGNDTITGGSGNDVIYGDEGDDVIEGASGGDFIDGGAGFDVCDGGTGNNQTVNCEG